MPREKGQRWEFKPHLGVPLSVTENGGHKNPSLPLIRTLWGDPPSEASVSLQGLPPPPPANTLISSVYFEGTHTEDSRRSGLGTKRKGETESGLEPSQGQLSQDGAHGPGA